MAQTCSKCSRVNPGEASYCYYDGSLLEGHAQNGGAVRGGTQSFSSHFVFPSGLICRNFDQLAQACQENWSSAVELLQQGYLENFLGGLGRADLAFAAREASRFPDRERGLDQLLSRLPTNVLEAPKLHAEPRDLNLGVMQVGDNRQFELHLANNGSRLLYGTVTADDCKWLTLGDAPGTSQKVFQFGSDLTIPVQVRGANLRAGTKPLEGRLLIESNGGNTAITVRCEVPVKPFTEGVLAGAKSPRQIAEKAKAAPKEAAPLFEKGVVADWYKANGWTYPVQGPSAAGLGAVQQFFEALGLTAPPKVDINEKFINFHGMVGASLRHTLEVKAQEKRPVFAHATSDQPWLVVEKAQLNGRTAIIGVTVPSVPPRPGETLQGKVTITSNGNQRFVVPVNLTVTGGYAQPIMMQEAAPIFMQEAVAPIMMQEAVPIIMQEAAPVFVEVQPISPIMAAAPVMVVPTAPGRPPTKPQIVPGMPPPIMPPPLMADQPGVSRRRGAKKSVWVHLIPLFALALGLLGMVIHDLFFVGARDDKLYVNAEPLVEVNFLDHKLKLPDGDEKDDAGLGDMSLRFGITLPKKDEVGRNDILNPDGKNRLTYHYEGATNNACVQFVIDEKTGLTQDYLLGSEPKGARWIQTDESLGQAHDGPPDKPTRERSGKGKGRKSVFRFDDLHVQITQIVELIPGEQPTKRKGESKRMYHLERVLVRYVIENLDNVPKKVGLRFLLDTFIGSNDGVPFTIPGESDLIDTMRDFQGEKIPKFIQALENADFANPGTVAHLSLRVPKLETPSRVTLGIWPDVFLKNNGIPGGENAKGLMTRWHVPFLDMQLAKQKAKGATADSAVVMYWDPKEIAPKGKREVGFIYGLGNFTGKGNIGITVDGTASVGNTLTVTALIKNPKLGQKVEIILPKEFTLVSGGRVQTVDRLPAGAQSVAVTWQIRPTRHGDHEIKVKSESDVQTQSLWIEEEERAFQ